jgi:hypothetical protein
MNKKVFSIFTLLVCLMISVSAQTRGRYTNLFSEEKIKSTVKFLSDDGFEGRAPGSRGGELAAKYIANQLEMIGIKPAIKIRIFSRSRWSPLKPIRIRL